MNGENKWLKEITKYRVVDQNFRAQIEKDTVYTCEKHFKPDEIQICKCDIIYQLCHKSGCTNIPCKKDRKITERTFVPKKPTYKYKKLTDVIQNAFQLKSLNEWIVEASEKKLVLKKMKHPWTVPQICCFISPQLLLLFDKIHDCSSQS